LPLTFSFTLGTVYLCSYYHILIARRAYRWRGCLCSVYFWLFRCVVSWRDYTLLPNGRYFWVWVFRRRAIGLQTHWWLKRVFSLFNQFCGFVDWFLFKGFRLLLLLLVLWSKGPQTSRTLINSWGSVSPYWPSRFTHQHHVCQEVGGPLR
jgi:hypothetical protein